MRLGKSEDRLRKVLAAARAIGDEWFRAEVLAAMAPHLSEELLPDVLSAAQAIGGEGSCAQALARVEPRLAELGRPEETLDLAWAIGGGYLRGGVGGYGAVLGCTTYTRACPAVERPPAFASYSHASQPTLGAGSTGSGDCPARGSRGSGGDGAIQDVGR